MNCIEADNIIGTKVSFMWEQINNYSGYREKAQTLRAKVIGGWLVMYKWYLKDEEENERITCSSVFVPDINHEWKV